MKTIIPMIALAAGLLVAASSVQAKRLHHEFCEGNEFFGIEPTFDVKPNAKGKKIGRNMYPHLHCGSRFITYSPHAGQRDRINFLDQDGLSVSKAANVCIDTNDKGVDRLTAKVAEICEAYDAQCDC